MLQLLLSSGLIPLFTLTQGPAVGRGIAELILEGAFSSLDLTALSFDRLSTGSIPGQNMQKFNFTILLSYWLNNVTHGKKFPCHSIRGSFNETLVDRVLEGRTEPEIGPGIV